MATKEIKQKIVLEGEKEYSSAIKDANRNLKTLRSELKADTAELGSNASASQKAETKAKSLKKQIAEQEKVVAAYRAALEEVREKYGDNEDAIASWEQKLNNARATLGNMRNDLDSVGSGLKGIQTDSATAVVAAKSVADSLTSIGQAGQALADKIEGIFTGIIGTIQKTVTAVWGQVMETAARAGQYNDLASMWNTSAQNVQMYAHAVQAAGADFATMQNNMTKIVMGDHDKIAELTGVSWMGDTDQWQYAMDVLSSIASMDYSHQMDALEVIFGDKKATGMKPLLDNWSRIQELLGTFNGDKSGYGMTSEQLETMDELDKKISAIEEKWIALKDRVAAGLGTAALNLLVNVEGMLDGAAEYLSAESDEEREEALKKIRTNLEEFFAKLGEIVEFCINTLNEVGQNLQKSEDPVTHMIGDIMVALTGALQWIADNWESVKIALGALFGVWLIAKLAAVAGSLAGIVANLKLIQGFKVPNYSSTGLGKGSAATPGSGTGTGISQTISSQRITTQTVSSSTISSATVPTLTNTTSHVTTMYVGTMIGGTGTTPYVPVNPVTPSAPGGTPVTGTGGRQITPEAAPSGQRAPSLYPGNRQAALPAGNSGQALPSGESSGVQLDVPQTNAEPAPVTNQAAAPSGFSAAPQAAPSGFSVGGGTPVIIPNGVPYTVPGGTPMLHSGTPSLPAASTPALPSGSTPALPSGSTPALPSGSGTGSDGLIHLSPSDYTISPAADAASSAGNAAAAAEAAAAASAAYEAAGAAITAAEAAAGVTSSAAAAGASVASGQLATGLSFTSLGGAAAGTVAGMAMLMGLAAWVGSLQTELKPEHDPHHYDNVPEKDIIEATVNGLLGSTGQGAGTGPAAMRSLYWMAANVGDMSRLFELFDYEDQERGKQNYLIDLLNSNNPRVSASIYEMFAHVFGENDSDYSAAYWSKLTPEQRGALGLGYNSYYNLKGSGGYTDATSLLTLLIEFFNRNGVRDEDGHWHPAGWEPEEMDAETAAMADRFNEILNRVLGELGGQDGLNLDPLATRLHYALDPNTWKPAGGENGANTNGITHDDITALKNLPAQLTKATKEGTAEGVRGIRVYMDGNAVGHLVAPTVSREIAQRVLV